VLVSIDPGLQVCGLAAWQDGALVRARLVKNPRDDWTGMLGAVDEEINRWAGLDDEIIIELPQVYQRIKSKGDPNDLVRIAVLVGAIVARRTHKLYLPAEWKGQTPKDVTELRARKRLSEEELAHVELPTAKGLTHNVWDAVGLGLRHLGR
jgi:hypothetical protein